QLDPVVEWVDLAGHLLSLFMPLAEDRDGVSRVGAAYRLVDRRPTPGDLDHVGGASGVPGTSEHLGSYHCWIFGPRVVVRYHDDIRGLRGRPSHERTLGAVTIAPRADNAQEPTGSHRPQRGQHRGHRVRLVGVV